MTRQTNRVGMHSVDFQGGKASSTSTSTNFSSVVWLRLLSTLDSRRKHQPRIVLFVFSNSRLVRSLIVIEEQRENGKTSSDPSRVV